MTATAAWPIFQSPLVSRESVAERTMAFRFTKPADWTYRAGQFVDLTGPPGMILGLRTMLVASGVDEDDMDRRVHRVTRRTELVTRLDYSHELPAASRAMVQLEHVVDASTLEPKLRELVKLRASQINGCAYCVDMHTKDADAMGEDAQRSGRAGRVDARDRRDQRLEPPGGRVPATGRWLRVAPPAGPGLST